VTTIFSGKGEVLLGGGVFGSLRHFVKISTHSVFSSLDAACTYTLHSLFVTPMWFEVDSLKDIVYRKQISFLFSSRLVR
jgi:hypothetical protein